MQELLAALQKIEQAGAMIDHCAQAPFGRGEQTVVDTNVRRVWQLDPGPISAQKSGVGRSNRGAGRACEKAKKQYETDRVLLAGLQSVQKGF